MKLKSFSDLRQILPNFKQHDLNPNRPVHDGKGRTVCVVLETQGRKGKSVTVVAGLHHNPATMEEIARILKQHCGAGGTVKNGNVEIQGDQRVRVTEKMKEMGYEVKG